MGPKSRGRGPQFRLLNAQTGKPRRFLSDTPPFVALCHSSPDAHPRDISVTACPAPDDASIHAMLEEAFKKALERNIVWVMPVSLEVQYNSSKVHAVFQWHRHATMTFVQLHDLAPGTPHSSWRACKWFCNPWLLPALLGSTSVKFFDKYWAEQPDPTADIVSSLTKIPPSFLFNPSAASQVPLARLFSWASTFTSHPLEERTRVLAAIFEPGIDRSNRQGHAAFVAFQERLLRCGSPDLSLLCWESEDKQPSHPVLADSVEHFSGSELIYAKKNELPLSLENGYLIFGGELEVSAVCYDGDGQTLLMEAYGRDTPGDPATREGLTLLMVEVEGAFVRQYPYIFQPVPLKSTPTRRRILLRTSTTDQFHFIPGDIESDSTTRASSPQPPLFYLPLLALTNPYTLSHAKSQECWRQPSKRSLAETDAEDENATGSWRRLKYFRVPGDERMPIAKRFHPGQEQPPIRSLPPTGFAQRPFQESDKGFESHVSTEDAKQTDDEAKGVGEMEDVEENHFDREDYDIFNDIESDEEEDLENDEFSLGKDRIVELAWDIYSQGQSVEAGVDKELFTCPFYAFNQERFFSCLKDGGFEDILALKSHLASCHRQPPRCPRCFETFADDESKNLHIAADGCENKDPEAIPRLEITAKHLPRLYRRLPDASDEVRWQYIYETVLPGPVPISLYLRGPLGDAIRRLHAIWGKEGEGIMADVLKLREGVKSYGKVKHEERKLTKIFREVESLLLARIIDQHGNRGVDN